MSKSVNRASEVWDLIKPFAVGWFNSVMSQAKGEDTGSDPYAIILYDESGQKKRMYSFSFDGLRAALAAAVAGDVVWLPAGTITPGAASYTTGDEISNGAIAVTNGSGIELLGLTVGNWYAVEATGGPWGVGAPHQAGHYHFSLSNGNGFSGAIGFQASDGSLLSFDGSVNGFNLILPDFCTYAEAVDALHGRAYFQAQTPSIFIRVCDAYDGAFFDNIGALSYSLKNATPSYSVEVPAGVELVGLGKNAVIDGGIVNEGKLTNLTVTGAISGAGEYLCYDSTGQLITNKPLDLGSQQINNLADPTEAQDAATKAYVDANSSATPPAGQISRLRFDGLAADAVTITDDSSHNGFPGLAKLADGTLIVVYRKASNHAPSKGVIAQKISTDGGKTWGSESTIYSHATADAREPCLTVLSDGSLALTFSLLDAATAAYLPGDQVYILKSTDGGATWGSPVNVNNTGFTSWSYTSSPVLELVNGNLILAVYGQMTGDTYRSVRVVVSTNDGASWGSSTLVASGQTASKDYDEPNLVQLANGDVLCAFKNLTDLRGYVSTSTDRGATWGTAADEFACGGCPRLLRLTSDTVLCHTRQPITNTLVAYTSTDGGATWSDAVTISATTYDSVYSQAVEQAGGLIAIAYALELVDQTDANVYMAWLGEGASTLPLVAKSLTVYGGDVEIAGGGQFVSQTPTGTAPLDVQSTTVVPNLNADLLDGYHASQFLTAATHWEPVTNGDASSPEIVFHDGDVVMQEVNN
jgi:hypothetical protein